MTTKIQPTVGRQVWFMARPGEHPLDMAVSGDQPMAATIVFVNNDQQVDLSVLDHEGRGHTFYFVPLLNPGDEPPYAGLWAEWMPYQVGQAKKEAPPSLMEQAATSILTNQLPPLPPMMGSACTDPRCAVCTANGLRRDPMSSRVVAAVSCEPPMTQG